MKSSFSRLSPVCFERAKQQMYVSPNPPDESVQNVSKNSPSSNLPFGSSESYLFFNYLHDMNSIFRVAGINSEKVFGRIARITSLRVVCSYSRSIELQCQSRSYSSSTRGLKTKSSEVAVTRETSRFGEGRAGFGRQWSESKN